MRRNPEDRLKVVGKNGDIDWGYLDWYDPETETCLMLLDGCRYRRVLIDADQVIIPETEGLG